MGRIRQIVEDNRNTLKALIDPSAEILDALPPLNLELLTMKESALAEARPKLVGKYILEVCTKRSFS